jgi:hypothetical protein
MTVNIRNLCFAASILIATSSLAYSQTNIRGPKPTPPPQESHNNIFGDELKYGPIGGAKSKPQVEVLTKCRVKYSKELEISTVWTKRFGRTGWWCTYKPKRT